MSGFWDFPGIKVSLPSHNVFNFIIQIEVFNPAALIGNIFLNISCGRIIAKIIKNPFYKGMISYLGEINKGNHEAVVDEELWSKANKIISANLPGHRFLKAQQDYSHLLKGILFCGKCGSYFVSTHARGKMGNKFYYYECSRARPKLGCDTKRISATSFDRAVIDFLGRASKD